MLTRAGGALQAVGGAAEAATGAVIAGAGGVASATGIGAAPGIPAMVGGGLLAANGADNAVAGLRTAWTGEHHNTLTSQAAGAAAHALGASEETSERITTGVDLAQGVAGGAASTVTGLVRRAGTRAADVARIAATEAAAKEAAEVAAREAAAKAAAELAVRERSAASVADKLDRYLLNFDHPVGGPKARWFQQALGFTRENSGQLTRQLVFDRSKAIQTGITQYGTKFNQVIDVVGANGRTIPVTTAWIIGEDGVPKLVTAIPGRR